MTKFKIPGRDCVGCSSSFDDLEFQDEGVSLGTATVVDFVGEAVQATKSGSKVTVTVSGGDGGGGSDFWRGSFTMTTLYPAAGTGSGTLGAIQAGDMYRLVIGGSGDVTIGGEQYLNGQVIVADVDTPGQTTANWVRLIT